jgi:hypothetical protein
MGLYQTTQANFWTAATLVACQNGPATALDSRKTENANSSIASAFGRS